MFRTDENVQDGAAQRWYLTALHAAHSVGDHALAANILALMSNQQVDIPGKTSEALQLAAAAQKSAVPAPAAVQSLVAARSGLAYAAAGDLSGFQRTREQSLEALDRADAERELTPQWARNVTRTELDAITGRGMVIVAQRITGRHRQRLLTDAATLLHERALTPAPASQRSRLRHLTWLGLAYARAGNLDHAGGAARAPPSWRRRSPPRAAGT
ncbi:hypothetical protein ACFHW2_39900 [Actinomadura sp. LOL_016]|uniref:hypothetical protein n=1 Tax=unclassified Actinomadura TaxID=2626254 RepID=UPI003A8006DD